MSRAWAAGAVVGSVLVVSATGVWAQGLVSEECARAAIAKIQDRMK